MALTFVELTVDTKVVNAIEIGTATDNYILENSLSWYDAEQLELALAETTLADYTMPNSGVTADVYFAPFIRSLAELTSSYQRNRIRNNTTTAIQDLETSVAALEAAP